MGVQSFSDTSFGRWMWETGRDSQNPKTGAGGENDRERERKALDQSDDDRIEYETWKIKNSSYIPNTEECRQMWEHRCFLLKFYYGKGSERWLSGFYFRMRGSGNREGK